MSFRLIDANAIAEKYPEVNDMPCIFVDLDDNGFDNKHHFISAGISEDDKDCYVRTWALNELKLALEKLAGEPDNVRKISEGCYKSAVRAYENVIADRHSGSTIAVTKNIINRLIDVMPLTPIEDTEDVWAPVDGSDNTYICKRFPSLTKKVDKEGKVTYHDSRRDYCKDIATTNKYSCGFISSLLDQLVPITMPYNPSTKRIVVLTHDWTVGDKWYLAIRSAHMPSGECVPIDKFVVINEKQNSVEEITEEEFDKVYKEANFKPLSD